MIVQIEAPGSAQPTMRDPLTAEEERLQQAREGKASWRQWGPYMSERQWGTVREDYSADGKPWEYFPHDHARSRAYRWGEEVGSEWRTRCLWTGAVPHLGPPSMALVGSPEEVAAAILEYKAVGVSQFLFLGWPDHEEMAIFGREVLPLVRRAEQRWQETAACP